MSKVIQEMIDEEIFRLESSPDELQRVERFIESIGEESKPIYAKVSRRVFHDFLQVCKNDNIAVGQKLTDLVTEESKKNFQGKRDYNPAMDYKSLQARNFD